MTGMPLPLPVPAMVARCLVARRPVARRLVAVGPVAAALLVAVLAAVLAVLVAPPAAAQPPARLADQLTDDAGVLDAAGRSAIAQAQQQLRDAGGTQLFVVFVPGFDGRSGSDWAAGTAAASGLGGGDVLLAVAVQDRAYGVDVPQDFRLDAAAIDALVAQDVEPRLADGDWAGAAVAFADGLAPGSPPWAAIGSGAVLLAAGAGGYALLRRRRRSAAEADRIRRAGPYPDQTVEQLTARASDGLLAVDDAVRTSQLDLDYARLQFGEATVAPFAGTVGQARSELQQAFMLRQQLDDGIEESEPTQRWMLAELLELVQAADDRLDAQAAAFAQLRDLQAHAPDVLAGLASRITALTGRLPAEALQAERLRRRWAPAAAAPVADALPRAREQIAVAQQAVTAAQAELAAGRSGAAVPPLRAAETAVAAAQAGLDAIGARALALETAAGAVPTARAEVQAGITAAQGVDGADAAALAGPVAQAQQALAAADQLAAGPAPDPLAALARLDAADDALDAALAGAAQAAAARRDTAARAERAVTTARIAVGTASAAVAAHRDLAGTGSRTWLSEAERHLAAAEAALGVDPAGALRDAGAAQLGAERVQAGIQAARRARDEQASSAALGGLFGGSGGGWAGGSSYRSARGSRRSSSSGRSSSAGRRSSGGRSGGRRRSGGRF